MELDIEAKENDFELELNLCKDIECQSDCVSGCCLPCFRPKQKKEIYICEMCQIKLKRFEL